MIVFTSLHNGNWLNDYATQLSRLWSVVLEFVLIGNKFISICCSLFNDMHNFYFDYRIFLEYTVKYRDLFNTAIPRNTGADFLNCLSCCYQNV